MKRFCHTFATVFTAFWSIIRDSGYRIPGIISEINYSHLFLQSQDIYDAITYDNSEFIALGTITLLRKCQMINGKTFLSEYSKLYMYIQV